MSNAVDVLFVDGPKHGVMACVPRPIPTSIPVFAPDAVYTSQIVNIAGIKYRVAVFDIEDISVDLPAFIALHNHNPAWDLNSL